LVATSRSTKKQVLSVHPSSFHAAEHALLPSVVARLSEQSAG
jgi:hypothetical protein